MKCGELKINIGSGTEKIKGYVSVDISVNSGADIIRDIRKGLPFCNDSATDIRAYAILEHLTSEEFIDLMREIHRVLKDRGVLETLVPVAGSQTDFNDPTHQIHFSRQTFSYFEPDSDRQKLYNLPKFKTVYREIEDEHFIFKLQAVK